MLQIYNTLTKQKENFSPIIPKKITMYVCGMTVYDYCHIGHARVLVSFDVITRYLRAAGFDVNYVMNITDVDDKIIQRANELQEPIATLTERFIQAMHEDQRALNILPPTHEPRATNNIPAMINLIQELLDKKHAYIASNGDVYYAVDTFKPYGCLSHQDLEKLQAGARVTVTDVKTKPLDFVLWKLAKPNEPAWDSPWGAGRPGWHIECSAMSMQLLGESIDIHGGGHDLIFPHHENEIAQSEAATDKHFVNTWMHVGFLQVNKEKMSKSLGNFFLIRDVLAQWPAEVLRYLLLSSHYRSQLHYSEESLAGAHAALERFYLCLRDLPVSAEAPANTEYEKRFHAAMEDDFNTPDALAVLFDLAREINRLRTENAVEKASALGNLLRSLANILGILQQEPEIFLQTGMGDQKQSEIEKLIAERNLARKNKDWARADALRDQLMKMGVAVEDGAAKQTKDSTWRTQR